jgi:hypothetical protein
MFPPCVGILHGKTHHKIACMLSDIKRLQKEPIRPDLKLCDLVVAPVDGESEVNIELLKLGRPSPPQMS